MKKKKYIDLTLPAHKGMLVFPSHWHPKVDVKILGRHKREGRETRKIVLGSHSGTHMDAPAHFIPKGRTIDKIPLDICIGEAVLLNFSGKEYISVSDLKKKLAGKKNVERLIIRFGWSKKWGKLSYYKNYPYFNLDACKWLVKKGIKLLGMDTPSPDDPKLGPKSGNDSPNHKFLLKNNVVLIEYLNNLVLLKKSKVHITALPLRIKGSDGSPARVVAYDL